MKIELGKPITINDEQWNVANAQFDHRDEQTFFTLVLTPYRDTGRPVSRKRWIAYIYDEDEDVSGDQIATVVDQMVSRVEYMKTELSGALSTQQRIQRDSEHLAEWLENLRLRFEASQMYLRGRLPG